MRLGKVLRGLVGLAVVGSGFAVAVPAVSAEQAPEVLSVPAVVIVNPRDPSTATIIGVYRCFGGEPIHLWVSAKQGGPDPTAEGSGATVDAWYDTNITPAPEVNCDGRYHSVQVTVGQHPGQELLTSGRAWIQFCLVAPDPSGQSEFGIVASQSKYGRVLGVF